MERAKDHWGFLEEIDAPMWADLALEAKSSSQNIDHEWFHTSHPIHQCPSHQLKSAFSFSGEGSTTLDCDLQGPSTPKLPLSVSRSRGKHYKSKKWEGKDRISVSKPHPMKALNRKSSLEEVKRKSRSVNLKGTSEKSMVCERKSTVKAPENCVNRGNYESTSESNTSTVTSDISQKQQSKYPRVSGLAFGQTSELLCVMRNNLRKSCVTRQASRVEINNNNRESTGCKSSSGKSSVGSSSNIGYDVKSSTDSSRPNKVRNPDSINVGRLTQAAKNKVKTSDSFRPSKERNSDYINVGRLTQVAKNKTKASNLQLHEGTSNSINHQEAAKSKVQYQKSTKSFAAVTKDKAKEITAGPTIRDQKGTKPQVPRKRGEGKGFIGLKVKSSDRSEGNKPVNPVPKVIYFR